MVVPFVGDGSPVPFPQATRPYGVQGMVWAAEETVRSRAATEKSWYDCHRQSLGFQIRCALQHAPTGCGGKDTAGGVSLQKLGKAKPPPPGQGEAGDMRYGPLFFHPGKQLLQGSPDRCLPDLPPGAGKMILPAEGLTLPAAADVYRTQGIAEFVPGRACQTGDG